MIQTFFRGPHFSEFETHLHDISLSSPSLNTIFSLGQLQFLRSDAHFILH